MTFKKGNHPKTEFKKGQEPWNKGKKTRIVPKNVFKKGNKPWNKGITHSKETREKISEKLTGKKYPNRKKGIKFTEEHKRRIGESNKGKIVPEEVRKKISESHKGKKHSEETKRKISELYKGKHHSPKTEFKKGHKMKHSNKTKEKIKKKLMGHKVSDETKKKLRLATINYVKNVCGFLHPMVGYNEKRILDKLEEELNYKIIRQYQVEGYFVDGYIKELNLCVEVDERPKNKEKDIERERIIKEKLNCKFLRINDFD